MHDEAPALGMNAPAAQASHTPLPRTPAKLPGWQATHAERPVALDEDRPSPHGVHCVAPRMCMDVPTGQAVQALLPRLAANRPGPHSSQEVASSVAPYSPAGHWMQALWKGR